MTTGHGRPVGAKGIAWASVMSAAIRNSGLWILPPELAAVRLRTVKVIRERERMALRRDDGVLRCRIKAGVTVEGVTTVTLAVKWEEKGGDRG